MPFGAIATTYTINKTSKNVQTVVHVTISTPLNQLSQFSLVYFKTKLVIV